MSSISHSKSGERCRKHVRNRWRAYWKSFNSCYQSIIVGMVVLIYLLIGGAIFTALEAPEELIRIETIQSTRERLIHNLTVTFNVTKSEIEGIFDDFATACDNGLLVRNRAPIWQFSNAVFFATTVVTTIGYGTIVPSTVSGKIFCVAYAVIGIPLCVIFLAMIGQVLLHGPKLIYERLSSKSMWIRLLGTLIIVAVGVSLFVLIPAALLATIEKWHYTEAIYYVFITLSTIGFGDLVAGQQINVPSDPSTRSVYIICTTGWLFIGLAYLSIILAAIGNVMKKFWSRLKTRCSRVRTKLKAKRLRHSTSAKEKMGSCNSEKSPHGSIQNTEHSEGDSLEEERSRKTCNEISEC